MIEMIEIEMHHGGAKEIYRLKCAHYYYLYHNTRFITTFHNQLDAFNFPNL